MAWQPASVITTVTQQRFTSQKAQNLSQSQVSQSSWRSAMLTLCRAWMCKVGGIPLSSELLWPSICTTVMFQPWSSLLVANKMCYLLHWNKQTNTAIDHTQTFYLFACSLHQENKQGDDFSRPVSVSTLLERALSALCAEIESWEQTESRNRNTHVQTLVGFLLVGCWSATKLTGAKICTIISRETLPRETFYQDILMLCEE